MTPDKKWHFWIDRGGTFTDVVARAPDGRLLTRKLLSEDAAVAGDGEDAAVAAMRALLGLDAGARFPAEQVAAIRMGTTVATNALLEHNGEPTLLVTTKGFADALAIGYQNRPELFALDVQKPRPLYARVAEIAERVDARGLVLAAPDPGTCRAMLRAAFDDGLKAVAILFMHGYKYPAHESLVAEIAGEVGFTQISTSHGAAALMKFVARGDTAVADAYLSPILARYVATVSGKVGKTRIFFMQSSGGLAGAGHFRGKDAILSGPAGGIVGAVETARAAGIHRLIAFDMGGTSTDVSHYAGAYQRRYESEIAGVRLQVPMLDIHSVAAGGGSICRFDKGRFRVGPASAGAVPGPASYRAGGPLTLTDCNLAVGKLLPGLFPQVFGPGRDAPLDRDAVDKALAAVIEELEGSTGEPRSPEEVADGFLQVAVEHMARAIKRVSVERGHDITRYALVSFGGAGGQHACRVADALSIDKIMLHPLAGVLSALGMGLARLTAHRSRTLELPFEKARWGEAAAAIEALEAEATAALADQGAAPAGVVVEKHLHLKYAGSDTALVVPLGDFGAVRKAFAAAHRARFGFDEPAKAMIVASVSVEAASHTDEAALALAPVMATDAAEHRPLCETRFFSAGAWHEAPVYRRAELAPGKAVTGPAIIVEDHGTNVIEPGWRAVREGDGNLMLTRATPRPGQRAAGTAADPVMLEVFNNIFMGVAEEMGAILENTAHSVNIKERLDFSCAVFDAGGNLIANAPHMPVHLGSMGDSVKSVATRNEGALKSGDVIMLNDPYHGGTHLPDVTVVTPVFLKGDTAPAFFVASRGHHADIGGSMPGSMPPDSTDIADEGILFDNLPLVEGGCFREAEIRARLGGGRWPARNVDRNIADLKAQVAANEGGVNRVRRLVQAFGRDVVAAYMGHVRDNAEEAVRRVIGALNDGAVTYPMDNGAEISVSIRVDKRERSAVIDFTGTSPQSASNFNAPRAVTSAAVLYVFRALVADDIPLNAGCLAPLEIVVPEGCLLNPAPPAAVVAGNVETSQAVTNALLLATGAAAAAQGTMNNLTFGNDRHQYYETIAGGMGAGEAFDGASALQVHMTNSRLTDPEVLEWRYPVLVEEFRVRGGSGGAGAHRGGDGTLRKIRFLEEMDAAILSSHRLVPPPGLAGGEPGAVGRNSVRRADGSVEELGGADAAHVMPGDAIIIETPGGGGWGKAKD